MLDLTTAHNPITMLLTGATAHQVCALWAVYLQIGGSGVLVQPMTYIFDEEPLRWQRLLENLGEYTAL